MKPGRLTYLQQQEAKQKPKNEAVRIYRPQSVVLIGGPPLTRKERILQAIWTAWAIGVWAIALCILGLAWAFCQAMYFAYL